ncbi:hypothetical protein CPB84DRAFT_1753779 [Gymnopilus junonius]|uniref:Uncharacterized protein n=1 Tax=Gymnopilus junonius TaxID=109634 RepID=A0A9P5TFQ3_GYMJU|nr:hypothetical protein CPB84DRAFT_1753779 [Gymnopilus junonius]
MAEDITFTRIRITHHCLHFPYVNISMTDEVDTIIKEQANMPAAKIWETILGRKLEEKLLKMKADCEIDIIPIQVKEGIDTLAFTFKGVLDEVGKEIVKVAMDSTWKTNALGYELYGIVGKLNGQAIPLTFCFTASTNENVVHGAKDCLLCSVIKFVAERCPNIQFTLSDKDTMEINGF